MFPTGQSYDEMVDIFSFGIVLCEVRTLHDIFNGPSLCTHAVTQISASECAACDLTAHY